MKTGRKKKMKKKKERYYLWWLKKLKITLIANISTDNNREGLIYCKLFPIQKTYVLVNSKTWKHTCSPLRQNRKGKYWYYNGKEGGWQRSWSREVIIRNIFIGGRRVLVSAGRRGLAALNTLCWWAFSLSRWRRRQWVVWKRWGWRWRIARERWGWCIALIRILTNWCRNGIFRNLPWCYITKVREW